MPTKYGKLICLYVSIDNSEEPEQIHSLVRAFAARTHIGYIALPFCALGHNNVSDVCASSKCPDEGAQWFSGRVLDSRPKGRGFEPHRRHCVVVLEQD